MPVPVQCEQCHAKYLIEDRFAGKRAKCKRCGHIMSIPMPDPGIVELDDTIAADGGTSGDAEAWGGPAAPPRPPAGGYPQGVTSQPPRGWRPQDVVVEREGEVQDIPLSSPFPTYARPQRRQVAPLDWLAPLLLLLMIAGHVILNLILQTKLSSLPPERVAAAGGVGVKLWTLTLITFVSFFALVAPFTLGGVAIAARIMRFELPGSSYARAAGLASLPLLFVVIIGVLLLGGWADEATVRNITAGGILAMLPLLFFTTRLIFGLDWVSTIVAFLLACVFGGMGYFLYGRVVNYAKASMMETPDAAKQQVAQNDRSSGQQQSSSSSGWPSNSSSSTPPTPPTNPQVTAPAPAPFVPPASDPRRTSEFNLRLLGGALNAYYAANNNTWPPDLAAAQSTGIVGSSNLKSPYGPAASGGADYAYTPGPPNTASAADLVLAYDRAEYEKGSGATVLFANLTIRWIDKADVDRALARSSEVAAQYSTQAPPAAVATSTPPPAVNVAARPVNVPPPAVNVRPPGIGTPPPSPATRVPGADAAVQKEALAGFAEKVRAAAGELVTGVDVVPLDSDVQTVVRPLTPSQAFAVVRNTQGEDAVEVWVGGAGGAAPKKTGRVAYKVEPAVRSSYALSADGQRLLRVATFPKLSVKAVAVADGRELASVDLNANLGTPTVLGFLAGDRVLLRWEKSFKYGSEVVDLKSRKVVRQIDLPDHDPSPGNEAVSPDGRYFATTSRGRLRGELVNQLVLHSTFEGGVTRRLPIDALGGRPTIKTAGIAFSPDGTKVAALFTEAGNGVVVGWNVKTGKALTKEGVVVPGNVAPLEPLQRGAHVHGGSGAGRSLTWLAGGAAWLVGGSQLLDATDGRLIAELGATNAADQMPAGDHAVYVPFKETAGPAGLAVIRFNPKSLPAPPAPATQPKPAGGAAAAAR